MESNNTKIHFASGLKMLYLFPQIPPLQWINKELLMSNLHVEKPLWQNFGNSENIPRNLQAGAFHELF